MKIISLVKFVPDVDEFQYDYEKDQIDRSNSKQIINPDDSHGLAWALEQKKNNPEIEVEVVSMAPKRFKSNMEDFIRLGADKATLISDGAYQGSDSYVTSLIIATYLKSIDYDLILSGNHTLDGGTGHIGPQLAEILDLNQFSAVFNISDYQKDFTEIKAFVDEKIYELRLQNPCLLSVTTEMNQRLGFVRYEQMNVAVDGQVQLLTNQDLQLDPQKLGRKGSPTKVRKNVMKKRTKPNKLTLENDAEGIEQVYQFLVEKGYVNRV